MQTAIGLDFGTTNTVAASCAPRLSGMKKVAIRTISTHATMPQHSQKSMGWPRKIAAR